MLARVADGSLYAAVGGLPALRRLGESFYRRVLADELLAPVFVGFEQRHVEHVAVWLAEVFGGKPDYSERLGGHHALLDHHLGLGIKDEHRGRWLELMAEAVEETLADRPDLHAPLMAYFEWGTAIAQEVSQEAPGTDLGEPGPTPRWGTDGLID
jgi:hemoglobin